MATTTLGIDRLEVVGESNYQKNIKKVRRNAPLLLELHAEPKNPHDKNAVKVVARHSFGRVLLVGYLSRSDAKKYQPKVIAARKAGQIVQLPARVFGGTKQQPSLGVWMGEDYV